METPTGRNSEQSNFDLLESLERFQWSKDNIAVYPMVHFNGRDRASNDMNAQRACRAALEDGLRLVMIFPEWIVKRRGLKLEDIPDDDIRLFHAIPFEVHPVRWAHGAVVIGETCSKVMKNWYRPENDCGLSDYRLKVAVLEILEEERVLSSWQENL